MGYPAFGKVKIIVLPYKYSDEPIVYSGKEYLDKYGINILDIVKFGLVRSNPRALLKTGTNTALYLCADLKEDDAYFPDTRGMLLMPCGYSYLRQETINSVDYGGVVIATNSLNNSFELLPGQMALKILAPIDDISSGNITLDNIIIKQCETA